MNKELEKILDNIVLEKINKNTYIENKPKIISQLKSLFLKKARECVPEPYKYVNLSSSEFKKLFEKNIDQKFK